MSVQATGGTESTIEIGGVTYKLHVFNGDGTFEVTVGGDIDYLIVGGGGSGGGAGSSTSGGGGAGGRRTGMNPTSAGSYSVVVGAGGASVSGSSNNGNPGADSSAFGLTAIGGGYGSRFASSGGDGGSGGGGGADSGSGRPGGAGTAGQGNDGGDGAAGSSNANSAGGGGGGAGGAGANAVAATTAGDGGVGVDLSGTFGTTVGVSGWFAGGGGGSGHNATAGAGGQGGGGAGGQSGAGVDGTANTGGGGGGGCSNSPSGAGGSGVVIFRYEVSDAMGIAAETDSAPAVSITGGLQQQPLTTSALGVVSELWMGHFTSNSLRASAVVTGSPTAVKLVASETDAFTQGWVGPADAPGSYNLVKLDVSTLVPGTKYYIALEVDGTVDTTTVGEMTTPAGAPLNFQFGSASCSRFHSRVVYNHIHGNNPDMMFFMHTGDLIYSDIVTNDEDLYQTAFSDTLNATNPRGLFEALPIPYIWDDHDYSNNNSGSEAAGRPAALAAFRRRVPTPDLPAPGTTVDDGVYYTFKIGRIRFIVTDLRSQRSDKSAVPEGPDRTMLGGQQKTWFYEVLEDPANEDDFFCWVNTVPWIGTASSSGDFWNGYATEREELATFFRDSGVWRRLFILSGDMHALTHDDGTNSDYADGGGAPLWVFQCAPIAQSNSIKGGPYSAPVIQENSLYGVFDVVDTGGQSITVNFSGRYVSESTNSETEVQTASMTLTVPRRVSAGLAEETSSAFGVAHSAASLVETAGETDSALAVTNAKQAHVGLATETNAGQAVTRGKDIALGLAASAETAESVAPVGPNVVLVSRATSASAAFAVSGFKRAFVGLATETDAGLVVRPVNLIPVGLATSTETASVTTPPNKVRILALAKEQSQALALSSGLAPFWWVFHDQATPGRRPSRQKHRPVVFTDRDDATTYVIVRNSSGLLELRVIQPTRHEEVYAPFHEPVMVAGGRYIRVYVEEGELLFEEYPHRVRSRPILFGDKERTRSRDKRYILTLPDDAV